MKYRKVYLKDIAEITMGQSPKSDFYNKIGVGVEFLQGIRTFGENFPTFDTYTTEFKREAKKGEILFSVRAPVGTVNWADREIAIGRGLAAIKINSGVDTNYIYYYFKKIGKLLDSKADGTVFTSINKKSLENLELKIPASFVDQRKIGNEMAVLDSRIELNQKINDNLETIIFSIFNRLRSKEKILMKNVANVSSSKRIFAREYTKSGIPFYRGKEISLLSSSITPLNSLFISTSKYEKVKSKNRVPQEKDILITSVGTIGNIYQVDQQDLPFYFKDGNIIQLSTIPERYQDYLYYWLKSNLGQQQIIEATIGSTQKALTISSISNFTIDIPNENDLKKFSLDIRPLKIMISNNRKNSNTLKGIKNVLLKKFFN